MPKKGIFITAKHRVVVLLPSVFCAFMGYAQSSLPERLNHVLEEQDMELGIKLYNEITPSDLELLPDSSLFDYHYLGGYLNSEIPNHEKAVSHLLAAKKLCDTKLGTYSIGYMEIMRGLGDEYLELDKVDDALAAYQEGIVKTTSIRSGAPKAFANLIMGVQDCYERLGWFNEVPNHLMDAWSFWPKEESPLETYTYYPLWRLEQFYSRYGMYEKALSISDEIEKFIISKAGDSHPELCEALYMKGNILKKSDRPEEAIAEYKRAIVVSEKNKIKDSEILGLIYGNLLTTLASTDNYAECERVLKEIKTYSDMTNNRTQYVNALFSLATIFNEKNNYALASEYSSQLMELPLSPEEKTIVEQQINTIQYNKEITESQSILEEQFNYLEKGSREWFEVAHNLSCAYFIIKDKEKNDIVLRSMYQEISSNPEKSGLDYHFWVLMNLYGNCLEKGDYSDALNFALEKLNYIASVPNASDLYRVNARNDVVVAKLRTNNLEGIDSDLSMIETFYRAQFGEMSDEYATYLHNRGRAYQFQGKFDEAKESLLKSISIQTKLVGRPMERTIKYYMEVEEELGEL